MKQLPAQAGSLRLSLAHLAKPIDLQPMTVDPKVEPMGQSAEERVEVTTLKCRHRATILTHHMMLMALFYRHVGVVVIALFRGTPMNPREPAIGKQQIDGSVDRRSTDRAVITPQIFEQLLGAERLGIPHDALQDRPARLCHPVSLSAQVGEHVLYPHHTFTPHLANSR